MVVLCVGIFVYASTNASVGLSYIPPQEAWNPCRYNVYSKLILSTPFYTDPWKLEKVISI